MRLSIIIPVYNAAKFLPKCLDSILVQDLDFADYEILIINDGSTDDSLTIANSYSSNYGHVKVSTKANGGVGSARNKGLSLAKGDYIYFIDPDDYLAEGVLRRIIEQAENNDLEILTFGTARTTNSKLFNSTTKEAKLELSPILNGENYIAKNYYHNEVWWYVIKRAFIEKSKINFIEGRWMEDAILTAKLFLKATTIAHFPIDAHRHLIIEGSAMTNRESSHYLKVIDDNRNAALVFESMIQNLLKSNADPKCIKRLRTRQQSFIFFLMVRMLKSTISFKQVKKTISEISNTNAYPLNAFPGDDYKGKRYALLTRLFNKKQVFYIMFSLFNPFFKKTKN